MSDPVKTLYLIDGHSFIYRAFHAIRGLTNTKGLPTNAVFGFANMLLKLVNERSPQYLAVMMDAKGKTFRHDMYPQYKANRPPMPDDLILQIPLIIKMIKAFRLPFFQKTGFEADDLIGTVAKKAGDAGFSVVMVTGDKDYVQLVTETSRIYDPMKERTIDMAVVDKEYGLSPEKVIDVMGLSGDTSDNVPGVKGIGPKTAIKLIQQFGSMNELYENLDLVTAKRQHENLLKYKDQAFLSRRLVTIDTKVPLELDLDDLKMGKPDQNALLALFTDLDFHQLKKSLMGNQTEKDTHYTAVYSKTDLKKLARLMEKAPSFALDTETTSKNPMRADLVGISVCLEPFTAFYIPVGHRYLGAPEQLSISRVKKILGPVLADPKIKKQGQNIKYDWMVLKRHGFQLEGVDFDTMVASYVLNPVQRSHGLDRIAMDHLGVDTISYSQVAGKGKSAITFDQVSLDKAIPYACQDADITLRAARHFSPLLEKSGLTPLFRDMEMPLVKVLMNMEMHGIRVDRDRLSTLSLDFAKRIKILEGEIHDRAGEKFNIKSSQQLGRILFEKLKLPTQKKTAKKTGYSTDVEVLTALAEQHELPGLVLEHRSLSKLKSTYADALLGLIHPRTGRIHTSFNQTVTATGRLSSSDPNLQNIPIRTEEGRSIRAAFVPDKGCLLLGADYSQIELRILAHVSRDPILIRSFMENEDIHTRTASEVFGIDAGEVTLDLRRQAKAINFGIIYGMSPYGLSKELSISRKMAENYINMYFERYQKVREYLDKTVEKARETRSTQTLLGRIRNIPEISSSRHPVRQFAERAAINTPIQGTAADLLKLAMIKVEKDLKSKGLAAKMLLTVHDELVFEVPEDQIEKTQRIVVDSMESVWDLKVPLVVNAQAGPDWATAH